MISGLYSIPRHAPFLATLAAGLRQIFAADPLAMADTIVLLPNRRSVRVLRDAFLNQIDPESASVLPRLLSFGDVAEDDFTSGLGALLGEEALPPPISSQGRLLHLARFVQARDATLGQAQALAMARQLGSLFNELALYECDSAQLPQLVSQKDFAEHWQHTLKFTSIITQLWPDYLQQIGRSDPALYRAAVMRRLTATWTATPPDNPVIMAGVARAEPVIMQFAQAVLQNPHGAVVLPGLDTALPPDIWANLDKTHPDSLLRDVVLQLGPARENVQAWPATPAVTDLQQARADWLGTAMLPAPYTKNWQQLGARTISPLCLQGVAQLTADDEAHEAAVVALAVRQALVVEGQTVALLTADRTLARRVAALLQRWEIVADDSSGLPFSVSRLCIFLQLIATVAGPAAISTDLLALLKHPLCRLDVDVAQLETKLFRGHYPAAGFVGLVQHLQQHGYAALVDDLVASLQPFATALQKPHGDAATLLRLHMAAAESLASAETLWFGAEGEVASAALAALLENMPIGTELATTDYLAWLMQLLATLTVRVPYGQHPRVIIHGLIEARLQHADVMIVAGLNEGVWPSLPAANPWLNRNMRTALGLPSPDEVIAQQAHDFVSAMAAPTVLLTRAARRDGAPTVPARWWHRLQAVLAPARLDTVLQASGQHLLDWARQLDHVDDVLLLSPQPPAPTPPVKARPRSLSVTAVETWLRNPYGLYAKEILRLKKLDDLTDEPNAAARGSFIHAVLADFAKQVGPRALTAADWPLLEGAGRKALAEVAHLPSVQAFWWPWFIAVARWWWQTESVARPQRAPHVIEERGTYTWPEWPGGPFTLHAKADRIDTSPEGAVVIDYKTGAVPSKKDVQAGLAAQLSLEALLVLRGGFDINASQGISTEYWRLAGTATQCEVKPMPVLAEEAEAGLHRLVAAFNNIAAPYMATPITAQRPRYDDYDHLARTAEWSIAEDEEGAA